MLFSMHENFLKKYQATECVLGNARTFQNKGLFDKAFDFISF